MKNLHWLSVLTLVAPISFGALLSEAASADPEFTKTVMDTSLSQDEFVTINEDFEIQIHRLSRGQDTIVQVLPLTKGESEAQISLYPVDSSEFDVLECRRHNTECAWSIYQRAGTKPFVRTQVVQIERPRGTQESTKFSVWMTKRQAANSRSIVMETLQSGIGDTYFRIYERGARGDPFRPSFEYAAGQQFLAGPLSDNLFFLGRDTERAWLYHRQGQTLKPLMEIAPSRYGTEGLSPEVSILGGGFYLDGRYGAGDYGTDMRVFRFIKEKSEIEVALDLSDPSGTKFFSGMTILRGTNTFAYVSDQSRYADAEAGVCGGIVRELNVQIPMYDLSRIDSPKAKPTEIVTLNETKDYPYWLSHFTSLNKDEFLLVSCGRVYVFRRNSQKVFVRIAAIPFKSQYDVTDYEVRRVSDDAFYIKTPGKPSSGKGLLVFRRDLKSGEFRQIAERTSFGLLSYPIELARALALIYDYKVDVLSLE